MTIKVSVGEVIDKLSILDIKLKMIQDNFKLLNVEKEYQYLREKLFQDYQIDESNPFFTSLLQINISLWEVEDEIRWLDSIGDFGLKFIRLAQSVYRLNDERAALKKEINIYYNSEFVEEKSYKIL